MSKSKAAILFGSGCKNDWPWYFEGESTVKVREMEDVFEWLAGCEYLTDQDVFMEKDFWQHPRTFELLRKGDCEDHALWAWRKLTEIGISAEFVCGKTLEAESKSRHAWVIFHNNGIPYILETTCKNAKEMVSPLSTAKYWYQPHAAVDSSFKTYIYDGAIAYSVDRFERASNTIRKPKEA